MNRERDAIVDELASTLDVLYDGLPEPVRLAAALKAVLIVERWRNRGGDGSRTAGDGCEADPATETAPALLSNASAALEAT